MTQTRKLHLAARDSVQPSRKASKASRHLSIALGFASITPFTKSGAARNMRVRAGSWCPDHSREVPLGFAS